MVDRRERSGNQRGPEPDRAIGRVVDPCEPISRPAEFAPMEMLH